MKPPEGYGHNVRDDDEESGFYRPKLQTLGDDSILEGINRRAQRLPGLRLTPSGGVVVGFFVGVAVGALAVLAVAW